MKKMTLSGAMLLLCLSYALPAQAASWFVRPKGGAYGTEDGSSYANAFDGGTGIVWGSDGVSAGDTLYICGEHTTIIVVKASGTTSKPITLDGKCSAVNAGYKDGVIGRREFDDIGVGSGQMISLYDDAHVVVQNLTFENPFGAAADFNWGGWSLHAQNPFGTHDAAASSTVLTDIGNGDCTSAGTPHACCTDLDAGTCNTGYTKSGGLDAYLRYDNQFRGGVIFNITDGSKCVITSSTGNTITCAGLSGGTDNTWQKGDKYRIQGDTGAIRISGVSSHILIRNNTFSYTETDVGFAIIMYVTDSSVIDHVTIDNNLFDGGAKGGDVMIVPRWTAKSRGTCNNMTVSNNTFKSVEAAFGMSASSYIDPDGDGDNDDDFGTEHLDINNNTINIVDGGRWAIKTLAVKALSSGFNYIRNNRITTDGIQQRNTNLLQIHWSKDLVIENNTIEGPTLNESCDGCAIIIDWAFLDDPADHLSDGVIIRNNVVYGAHRPANTNCIGKGISVYRGRNVDVSNNLVYDCDIGIKVATQNLSNDVCAAAGKPHSCCTGAKTGTCDTAYETSGVRVLNNTVHNSGLGDCGSSSWCGDGIMLDANLPTTLVMNNIVSASTNDGIDAKGSPIDADYNLIHDSGAEDCKGYTCGQNTITGADPLFANTSSFQLKASSPAINAGVDLGLSYCGAAPEIGYWEQCGNSDGKSCGGNSDCLSKHCVDGVCCDSACSGVCMACNVAGKAGNCSPVVEKTDPDGDCGGEQSCDGAGACAKLDGNGCADNADCISGHCVDNTCCDSACDGSCKACNLAGSLGVCSDVPLGSVDVGTCAEPSSCDGSGGCKKASGQPCSDGSDCATGFCADGVCCDAACDTPCYACNLQSGTKPGACSPIPANVADPTATSPCDGDDRCDGKGSCKPAIAGTCTKSSDCATGFCVDGVCCKTACTETCKACNLAGSEGSCTVLRKNWADDYPVGACSGGQLCDGHGNCLSNLGQSCDSSSDCASGYCVDGVCCDEACDETCETCDAMGSEGTCTQLPANSDPDGECLGIDVQCSGTCDGAGSCRFPDAGTRCGTCSTCDDAGKCGATPADDPACGVIACDALDTDCREYDDLRRNRCESFGSCKPANDAATCSAFIELDCASPPPKKEPAKKKPINGGCSVGSTPTQSTLLLLLLLLVLIATWRDIFGRAFHK